MALRATCLPLPPRFPGESDPVTLVNVRKAIAVFEATLLTPNAPFGLVAKPRAKVLPRADKGRFAVTKSASDEYVFKVPSLRNIALTPPYFHAGQVWDLREAIEVMGTAQLGSQLTPEEVDKLVAFLATLMGEQPKIELSILPPSVAATPRPQP